MLILNLLSAAKYACWRMIMPTLQLTAMEANLLKELLESDLSDLRMEIGGTDLKSFRDKLKEREAAITALIARLESK